MKKITHANSPGLLQRIVGFAAAVALVSLVLMFSAVVFAVIAVAGLLVWAYLWWKTRELRRQMRSARQEVKEEMSGTEIIRGEVIEGESVRVNDPLDKH